MAGSSISVTRSSKEIQGDVKKEVILTVSCVSDDTNGTVPNLSLTALNDYVLTECKPVPDGVAPPTNAFSLIIVDATDGNEIFDSKNIATGSTAIIGGHTGSAAGHYPRMIDSMTLKLVTTADHSVAADLGNSKEIDFKLRLERR